MKKMIILIGIILLITSLYGCSNKEIELLNLENTTYINEINSKESTINKLQIDLDDIAESYESLIKANNEIISNSRELESELNKKADLYEELELIHKNDVLEIEIIRNKIMLLEEEIMELKVDSEIKTKVHENPFNISEVNEGDQICGLSVTYANGAWVYFKGAMIVSGRFIHYNEDEFLGTNISFQADSEDLDVYPKEINDGRIIWFLFNDYMEIKDNFGLPGDEGHVTLVIDDYSIIISGKDLVNTASYVKIIDIEIDE